MVNEMVKDGIYDVRYEKTIKQTHVHLIPLSEISNAGSCRF
jgi:hypothetical protein